MSRKQKQRNGGRFEEYKSRHAESKCDIQETLDWYSDLLHGLREQIGDLPEANGEAELTRVDDLVQKAEDIYVLHERK